MAGEGGNIVRNVFGKSYKEAESIMKDASNGPLDFKSPHENTFYGKKGGKKFDEYQAKKDNTLLVTKVEGPLDDNGKKVDKPKEGLKYWFKATFNRSASKSEYKRLQWQKKINGISIPLFFDYSSLKGNTSTIQVKIPCHNMRVYAYFKSPTDQMCVEVKLCKCTCCGEHIVTIKDTKNIKSYKGEFPSPFQIMNHTPSKNEPLKHLVYVADSTIRDWIRNAAKYHGIPHEMIAIIIQQENAPKASKWKQFLQFGERTLTTTASELDRTLWDMVPDKIADGSAGFMNMRRPTLKDTINYTKNTYCKELMPKDIANRIGYIYDSNVDVGVQGLDWRADLYYGAAHIRQLIDRVVGQCAKGMITLDQIEKVFASYNGSGPIAKKYGKDAIDLLKKALNGQETLYFYEK
ncbi:hypothetical protein [Pedobacter sp. MW01-1-1]|uniref:hypothetical protein n=1 Tax=Pedobacter sp. MW01-1-1 TaxID=3383027 RepID=UPI003FEE45D9